jgi:hypothetical protein
MTSSVLLDLTNWLKTVNIDVHAVTFFWQDSIDLKTLTTLRNLGFMQATTSFSDYLNGSYQMLAMEAKGPQVAGLLDLVSYLRIRNHQLLLLNLSRADFSQFPIAEYLITSSRYASLTRNELTRMLLTEVKTAPLDPPSIS